MRKRAKNSLAHKILKAVAVGGIVAVAATNPYFGLAFMKGIRKDLERKKWWEFQRELKRLQRTKRLNAEQNPDGSFTVTITQLGKDYVARYDLDSLIIDKPKEWDGLWRIIILDLPEDRKPERESLRYLLKKANFVCIKNTVWISPLPYEHLFTNIKK